MTTRKTHDADLCERIRELEKRLEELERRPVYTNPWWVVPYWPQPYWYYGTTTTGTNVTIGSTADINSTQYTLTDSGSQA